MRGWPPLHARILVVIGLALIIAATVANYYGAKTTATYTGAVSVGDAQGVAVYLMTLGGEGDVTVRLEGVSSALYVGNVTGDVMSLVTSLSVFNITVQASSAAHDARAGVIYGSSTLLTSPHLLGTLPTIARLLNFNIGSLEASNGTATVNVHLKPSQSVLVLGVPDTSVVRYTIDYRLTDYGRMSYGAALLLGISMIAAGILFYAIWARSSPHVGIGMPT